MLIESVIVYHDTETLARRSYRIKPGQTVAYRSIDDWSEEENAKYEQVIDNSTPITEIDDV